MPSKLLLAAAIILAFLSSCNPGSKQARIKTKYHLATVRMVDEQAKRDTTFCNDDNTINNYYDDKGNLAYYTSSNGSKTSNSRQGNKLIHTTTDSTGKVISIQTDFLNGKGQTDSFIVEKNSRVTEARKLLYDSAGNEMENRQYLVGGMSNCLRLALIWKYTYKDGNVNTETFTDAIPVDTFTMVNPVTLQKEVVIQRVDRPREEIHFDYYPDKLNTTKGNTNSKNLLRRSVQLYAPADTGGINYYRYVYDGEGRIASEVEVNDPRFKDSPTSRSYVYDSIAYTYY